MAYHLILGRRKAVSVSRAVIKGPMPGQGLYRALKNVDTGNEAERRLAPVPPVFLMLSNDVISRDSIIWN